jgi:hypothetical protein
MDIMNTSDYFQNQNYTNTLSTYAEHRNDNRQATVSAYYDIKFGKRSNKLSITGNYFSNTPSSNIDFTTQDNSANSYVVRTPSELIIRSIPVRPILRCHLNLQRQKPELNLPILITIQICNTKILSARIMWLIP